MNKTSKITALIGLTVSSLAFSAPERHLSSANISMPPSEMFDSPAYRSGSNAVTDPGFEGGSPNAAWDETSTNFGTPLCDLGSCGSGTATNGPNTGSFWAWFGGIAASEIGSVSQSVTIPSGSTNLRFQLQMFICDSSDDFLSVQIDGNEVFRVLGDDVLCGVDAYTEQSINISAFADDSSHTLLFTSEIFATNGGGGNFFVDDVSIDAPVPVELMNFSVE